MRLMTFNILHGRSPLDGTVVPNRLAAAVRELQPDLLALQEVDRDQPRSGRADLTALAAAAMDAVDSRFVATIAGTPGGTWAAATGTEQPGSATYGIALLSRFPVRDWRVFPLGRLPAPVPVPVNTPRRVVVTRDEPRAAVAAVVDAPHGQLTVATTHLSYVPGWNLVQLRRLLRVLTRLPGPRILMGDLNVNPGPLWRATRWPALATGRTFPSWAPTRQLDHVLADRALPVTSTAVVPLPLSDHCAVVVDL